MPSRESRSVVLAFGMSAFLFAAIEFPGSVYDIRVNGIGVLHGHLHIGKRKFRRIGKTGHAFFPMRAAENSRVPILVRLRRHVAQVGDNAVFNPRARAVKAGRVAAIADKSSVEHGALLDHVRSAGLLRRFGNGRNYDLRGWKSSFAVQFESVETHGTAF